MEKAPVGEPAVHVHEAVGGARKAVVRDDEGDGVRARLAHEGPDRAVEVAIDGAGGGGQLLHHRGVGAVGPLSGEMLPEEVLHAVGLVEDDRQQVARPLAHEPQRHLEPALAEAAEPGEVVERLDAVVGRGGDQLLRRLERDQVVVTEERAVLRRVDDVLRARRGQHAGDHEAVHRAHRVRRHDVDRAHGASRLADDLPQRARAQALRVDEVTRPIAGRRPPEAHHAVLAGVLAGHEGRPRGRGEGREGGVQLAVAARRHQAGELGQLARFHHRPEEAEGRPVEPDHEYLPCHACTPHAAARARRMPATSAESAR